MEIRVQPVYHNGFQFTIQKTKKQSKSRLNNPDKYSTLGSRSSYNNTHIHQIILGSMLRCKNKSWFHKGMCKNIVPAPVPVVIVSDVVSGVTVAGLVGPAVDVSTSVVVVATNYKFSDRFNKFIKTSMIMVVIFFCTHCTIFYSLLC